MVKYLIENGAFFERIDGKEWTALQWASANGHVNVAEYLLNNGADIEKIADVSLSEWAKLSYMG